MEQLGLHDLWEKPAYGASGQYIGTIEVVTMRRGAPRRVGIRLKGQRKVTYFQAQGAKLVDGQVVLAPRPSLQLVAE